MWLIYDNLSNYIVILITTNQVLKAWDSNQVRIAVRIAWDFHYGCLDLFRVSTYTSFFFQNFVYFCWQPLDNIKWLIILYARCRFFKLSQLFIFQVCLLFCVQGTVRLRPFFFSFSSLSVFKCSQTSRCCVNKII